MALRRQSLIAAWAAHGGVARFSRRARAAAANTVKLGVLTDFTGPDRGFRLEAALMFLNRPEGRRTIEVKAPEASNGASHVDRLLQTTLAEQAFRPLAEGCCPLVKT